MSDLVPAEEIETIVGARRQRSRHLGRAVSAEQTVYVLHSHECLASTRDLRLCRYSLALDNGIDETDWTGFEDHPVILGIEDQERVIGRPRATLVPLALAEGGDDQ